MTSSKKIFIVPALAAGILGAGLLASPTSAEAWRGDCYGPRGGYECPGYGPGEGRGYGHGYHRGWHHGGWHGNCPYYGERGDYRGYHHRGWNKGYAANLSPEQRKTYDKLVDDFNAKAEPLRDQMFIKRAELRALENSTNASKAEVDKTAREFLDLRNQMRDLHDKLVQDMEKAGLYRYPKTQSPRSGVAQKGKIAGSSLFCWWHPLSPCASGAGTNVSES